MQHLFTSTSAALTFQGAVVLGTERFELHALHPQTGLEDNVLLTKGLMAKGVN